MYTTSIEVDLCTIANIDNLIARDHFMRQFRPTAVALVQRGADDITLGREFLFVRSAKSDGDWNFPQGGVGRGEKVLTGLLREVEEEVEIPAIVVRSCTFHLRSEIRAAGKALRDGFNAGKSYYYFGLHCIGRPQVKLNPAELAEHLWLPPGDALTFIRSLNKRNAQKRADMLRALEEALTTT